jgi:predicted lipoprotein with Yx(FWY)xxD motif
MEDDMKHPGIVISSLAVAALAVGGGIVGFTSGGGSSNAQHGVTVKAAMATVGNSTETILETAKGLPLYTYQPDSPTQSMVTGKLAALWPPLTAPSPTSTVGGGQVTAVKDIHGSQVEFNGHLLYTFVTDRPGQVTGQGVQNFFVATPELMAPAGTPAANTAPPTTPPAANSYSYGY